MLCTLVHYFAFTNLNLRDDKRVGEASEFVSLIVPVLGQVRCQKWGCRCPCWRRGVWPSAGLWQSDLSQSVPSLIPQPVPLSAHSPRFHQQGADKEGPRNLEGERFNTTRENTGFLRSYILDSNNTNITWLLIVVVTWEKANTLFLHRY